MYFIVYEQRQYNIRSCQLNIILHIYINKIEIKKKNQCP